MIQAGIIFGFESDHADVFRNTLHACERLGIDGVTASILTPLPRTPIYEEMKRMGRITTDDWSRYNGKTRVTYTPKNMTPGQLYAGYMDFRRQFYSLRSFIKRLRISRTHIFYSCIINLGYRLSIH
jgi:hypothetical protein